jgi:hypothetical protein
LVDSADLQLAAGASRTALSLSEPLGARWFFAKGDAAMTFQQDTFVHGAAEAASSLPRVPGDARALVAILSTAKRNALLACLNGNGLYKKNGAWHGRPHERPVSGVTVADLARDGMFTLTTDHRLCSARLTERGNWFARTLFHDAAKEDPAEA